jgi:hypothetical protein
MTTISFSGLRIGFCVDFVFFTLQCRSLKNLYRCWKMFTLKFLKRNFFFEKNVPSFLVFSHLYFNSHPPNTLCYWEAQKKTM